MSESDTPVEAAVTPAAETPPAASATVTPSEGTANGGTAAPADEPVTAQEAAGSESTSGADTTPASVATGSEDVLAPTPESYDFKLPEGFTEDADLVTEARKVFAEAGVPVAKAQALVDLFASTQTKAAAAAEAAFNAQQTEWQAQLNALPELQGQTREKTMTSLGRLWDTYGTPEAKEVMNHPALGNNPALVKMFVSLAQALDEGTPAPAHRGAPNGKDGKSKGFNLAYPNTPEITQ